MNLSQLKEIFGKAGATHLYAKVLAENDNSKNQIYFGGSIEAINAIPCRKIYAESSNKRGPTFKAELNFGWLKNTGEIASAPHSKLILYAQYPEIRFSGFLQGCSGGPNELMIDRAKARKGTAELRRMIDGRILFLGIKPSGQILGYTAAGNSEITREFHTKDFSPAFAAFHGIPLAYEANDEECRKALLVELRRINGLGWIDSKQLDSNGVLKTCNSPQCGGFTLEAELGIPKNSDAGPDFMGWEVKQYAVKNFDRPFNSKALTLMTPEPTGGFYKERGIISFVKKFGYPDKNGKPDRFNFGGRHFIGSECSATELRMHLSGYDASTHKIKDADGKIALLDRDGEIAAEWSFSKIMEHWSKKHSKVVYVPSQCKKVPERKYQYGSKVRLAEGTDPLKLFQAMAQGFVYYDPAIKIEGVSSPKPTHKKRSQFRVASKNIDTLYGSVETVEVSDTGLLYQS